MARDILELSNSIVYHGEMIHGNDVVADQQLEFPLQVNSLLIWLEQIKKQSVTFLKTDKLIMKLPLKHRQ